jgi:hypothetical protein
LAPKSPDITDYDDPTNSGSRWYVGYNWSPYTSSPRPVYVDSRKAAEDFYYQMDPNQKARINEAASMEAGYKVPDSYNRSQWVKAVTIAQGESRRLGVQVSPWDVIDQIATGQRGSGGFDGSSGSGSGAGRAYSGPVSQVTNMSDIDIRRVANEYSMAAVGREVTDEEFARIKSRVQRAEERNPTRTEGKGAKRRTVSGLSAETRSQIIQDVTTNLVTKGLDSTGDLQADARENAEALRAWVRSNGLDMGEQAISGYVRRILKGDTTLDDVKSDLRRTYMQGMFPAWADKINAGEDPADFLAPYVSRVQQLLEDENIDLNDSLVKKATQFVGDDGKPRMLPLYEVERLARKDPRWQYTSNALDLYSRVGDGILRTFGMR